MSANVIPFPSRLNTQTQAEFDRLRERLAQIEAMIAQCAVDATAHNEKQDHTPQQWAKFAFIYQEGMLSLQYEKTHTLAQIMDLLGVDRTRSPNVMPGEYR